MLYRMMAVAGEYKIPEIDAMLVVDCAIALGVDQKRRPNRPYGAEPEPQRGLSTEEKLVTPSRVIVDPGLMAAIDFGTTA